ncbi:MAG: aminotransferase class IV [Sulfuricurvum sp.]|uniref:aminotransferase class IV family protein n=1 Tax=Sulfuricurvum sp. TaxID=2025608 RepID=UPI0025D99AAA|nr:aminotransferase class IV family protein [Sulfuricurvum sp.]MBV5321851.1 aminotransferase class IV [Sulfuricurvum sp.]
MLLETIRCEGGEAQHLSYHQQRLNRSLHSLGIEKTYSLQTLITPPTEGLYRCRFLYDAEGYEIEFNPYTPKKITSLKLIHTEEIEYTLKYSNRDSLNTLLAQRGECDEVLIVKNGFLTDTTIANIALFIEGRWLTPDTPLLEGTTRARLIKDGFLTPAPLTPNDIARSCKVAVMNAMIGFVEVESGIIT